MERELLLLGLLRHGGMHGYQLHEMFSSVLANCIDLKKPTAYFLLDKMAQRGWVTVSTTQEGNRPQRKVYLLTPEGEATFNKLLRENLATYTSAEFAGDIGLAFMDALPSHEVAVLLTQRREALDILVRSARAIPTHEGTFQFMIEHRVRHLEADLEWLDSVILRLTPSLLSTES
jgi:DNA-binding PadR family transcriptional regulator